MSEAEAKTKLFEFMSELSEKGFCAYWMEDLEFELWTIVIYSVKSISFGQSHITKEEGLELLRLAKEAGGWLQWEPDITKETEVNLISFPLWHGMYCDWVKSRTDGFLERILESEK